MNIAPRDIARRESIRLISRRVCRTGHAGQPGSPLRAATAKPGRHQPALKDLIRTAMREARPNILWLVQ
jgi:hypothetical protein